MRTPSTFKNRMKISTSRLKRIIKEELFYREFHRTTKELTEDMEGREDLEEVDKSLGSTLQGLKTQRMLQKHVQSMPPEDRTIAGTQNLDHLDPEAGDPEQNFFGSEGPVDHDDVGLQTIMNLTPDQMKRLRELMSRRK